MFDIDYVFPWVNDQDPVWQKIYKDYCKTHGYKDKVKGAHNCRYRDWGLLKYLFRCIAKNMPWIRKVHFIVSNIEQVPDWINTEEVHVVLHQDFMPSEVLPTFNSTTIEMFLPYIPDLAEHFIYGNDDMYPWLPSQPLDWFTEEGLPRFKMEKRTDISTQFDKVCSKEWFLLEQITNVKSTMPYYYKPLHGLVPLLKSKCLEVCNLLQYCLIGSCSGFRTESNMNQYIYTDYLSLTGLSSDSCLTFLYCSANKIGIQYKDILSNKYQIICINDNNKVGNKQKACESFIKRMFQMRWPNKCKYEK